MSLWEFPPRLVANPAVFGVQTVCLGCFKRADVYLDSAKLILCELSDKYLNLGYI